MPQTESIPVTTNIKSESTGHGTIDLETATKSEAAIKGLIWWGAITGFGMAFIFIPIIHFVIPPVALFGGAIVGWSVYRLHRGSVDCKGSDLPCPSCGHALKASIKKLQWPLTLPCGGCQRHVTVRLQQDGD